MRRHLGIVVDVSIAAVVAVLANIIANYLQDHYSLLNDTSRFWLVSILFIVSLVLSIVLRVRRQDSSDTQRTVHNVQVTRGDTIQQIAGGDIRQNFYGLPPVLIYLILLVSVLALTVSIFMLGSELRSVVRTTAPTVPDAVVQPTSLPQTTPSGHGGLFEEDQDTTPPLLSGPVFLTIIVIVSISLVLILTYLAKRDEQED